VTAELSNPRGGCFRCGVCHKGRARHLVQLPGTVRVEDGGRAGKYVAVCDTCAARLTTRDPAPVAAA
jgi:hypothetical protein